MTLQVLFAYTRLVITPAYTHHTYTLTTCIHDLPVWPTNTTYSTELGNKRGTKLGTALLTTAGSDASKAQSVEDLYFAGNHLPLSCYTGAADYFNVRVGPGSY